VSRPVTGLSVVRDPDPATFSDRVAGWLRGDPVRHNVICTLLAARLDGTPEWNARWLRVTDGEGAPRGVGIRIPPRGLLLSPMPAEAAATLADALADALTDAEPLPAVDGPTGASRTFAQRYTARTGRAATPGIGTRLYRLDTVTPPAGVPGRLREAGRHDRDLVVGWVDAFSRESVPDQPRIDAAEQVDQRLRLGGLMWLWEDRGDPVSFLWLSVPVGGVVRVSAVYTPPELRGRGYASACVAGASARALAAGADTCVLYTDRSNPTSNRIYQRIGYRPVDDSQEYRFS